MITLHSLCGEPLVVNADRIETIRATPDTVITLVDRRRLIVAETVDQVVDAALAYRRALLGGAIPVEREPVALGAAGR